MGFCGYFPCFGSSNKEESNSGGSIKQLSKKDSAKYGSVGLSHHINGDSLDRSKPQVSENGSKENHAAQIFTFQELAAATENFRPECLLGEGGFGRVLVYKGRFERTGQVVAVKRLDGNGLQGNRGFLAELLILNLLHHPNLVNLIGYCADADRRLLVFEFMPLGSLEDHLHGKGCPSFGFHDTCTLALAVDCSVNLKNASRDELHRDCSVVAKLFVD